MYMNLRAKRMEYIIAEISPYHDAFTISGV